MANSVASGICRYLMKKTDLVFRRRTAIDFLEKCIIGGLAHSYDAKNLSWVKPYPEVTGYLVSLFVRTQVDTEKTQDAVKKLLSLQASNGGYASFFETKRHYVFDTAQICRGLLDFHKQDPKYPGVRDACMKGAEFVLSMQAENGSFFPFFDSIKGVPTVIGKSWGDSFSLINCKTSEFLLDLFEHTGDKRLRQAVDRSVAWALTQGPLEETHPGAYFLEGLYRVGEKSEVSRILRTVFYPRIQENGFISFGKKNRYAYVSGSAQLGILALAVGDLDIATKLLDWCCLVQDGFPAGGLFQYANSDGRVNSEVHMELNSWGTKYFVELMDEWIKKT